MNVGAIPALTGYRKVTRLERKTELGVQPFAERLEHLIRNFDHRVAGFTDEMVVSVVCEVVHRRAVPQVHMVDDSKLLEIFQEAVNGRLVHVGHNGLNPGGELFGRRMVGVVDERLQNRPSRGSDAAAACPECPEHRIQSTRNGHRPSLQTT